MTLPLDPINAKPQTNASLKSEAVVQRPVSQGQPDNKKRNKTILWVTASIVFLGIIWFLLWFFYFSLYQSTDDAYANGNMITVNSAISGSVIAFYADDTDLVEEGQLLVKLDSTSYQVTYDRELAKLAETVLDVRQLFETVLVDKASIENKRAILDKARYDFDNRSKLVKSGAISNEDFTHSKDDFLIAAYNLEQAEQQLQVALAAAGNTSIEKHPLIEQQKSVIRSAYYNLYHCDIYAPATGYVAQRNVEVGRWINPVTDLLAIIPTNYVWVDANFKETQLRDMRVGQPAEVWFDLYGSDVKFNGKVLGIASGSGSVFSLIPPQNATGNWIKIVQRLPVRISLNPELIKKYPIRLGISANVDVTITDTSLPRLVQVPSHRAIAKTKVFDLELEELNHLMDGIVQANSKTPA
jgi:membrane fusion protein, multidrug efflux system